MSNFYVLIHGQEATKRNFPPHGFTPKSIAEKRFKENTTAAALSFNLVLPFLTRVNKAVEAHVDEGTEISTQEFAKISKTAGLQTAVAFVDLSARVTIQTALAVSLIEANKPLGNAVVYSWDMYPRLHRKYMGDFLQKLHLPRFIAAMLGPETQAADLEVFQTAVGPLAAFEDSVKRHVLYATADTVVEVTRALIEAPKKGKAVFGRLALQTTTLLSKALGAAGGRAVRGDVGEYWGEFAGAFLGPFVAARMILLISSEKKKKVA
eukprot:CAMPEP_0176431490 /NCGR_PEP_ID=MMETSP0127-20121128/14843_1 /TAXON_ID=938130 /ORGANISM="Platyophrya macrostoma, Strain WH" /LENGTH=264 /DNA_ID=CAMNT_0017813507 /DNA_START=40 /DNA_END=834 /DNA_ORIENTATION=+